MATQNNELVFRLIIDGKEAIATLDLTKGEFVETGAAATKANEQIAQTYKNLTAELLKYNSVNEQSVNGLTKFISEQNISVNMIENAITALNNEAKTLDVNSAAWKQKIAASDNLKAAYGKLITQHSDLDSAQKKVLPGMNSMNIAIGQFGYLLSDADMFLVNVRMGMMSIGNNVPMVLQYLQYAKQEAANLNMTVGQAFFQSISGPGGLLLGVNAAMLGMQLLTRFMSGATEEVEKQKDKIKELADAYKELSKTTAEQMKAQMDSEIFQLENKGGLGARSKGESILQWIIGSDLSSKDKERLQLLYDQRAAIIGQIQSLGEIDNLNKRISENEKAYSGVSNENLKTHYFYLTEYLSARGLEFTAANARKILKEWIDSDKKQLESLDLEKIKKFSQDRAKAITDILKDEQEQLEKDAYTMYNYRELIEEREAKEQELLEVHKKIKNARNETELTGYLVQKEMIEKSIKLLEDQTKKVEDESDWQIEAWRKEQDAKFKNSEDDYKDAKEKKKFELELPAKLENDPYERQKKQLDAEEALTIERAQMYGATEEEITNIHTYYSKQRQQIDFQADQVRLNQTSQMLGQLAGMFNKQTAAYKMLASAQVMIETYKGIMAAYAPPPVGVGPVLAPFMTGIILATGFANVANIMKQDTAMKGFETGGRLPRGKYGFFEGTHNEIVAPEEDFMTVAHELIGRSIIEAKNYLSVASTGSASNSALIDRIDKLSSKIEDLASRPARAYLDNDEAEKIGRQIDIEKFKSR